jgi:hypothetical protein
MSSEPTKEEIRALVVAEVQQRLDRRVEFKKKTIAQDEKNLEYSKVELGIAEQQCQKLRETGTNKQIEEEMNGFDESIAIIKKREGELKKRGNQKGKYEYGCWSKGSVNKENRHTPPFYNILWVKLKSPEAAIAYARAIGIKNCGLTIFSDDSNCWFAANEPIDEESNQKPAKTKAASRLAPSRSVKKRRV